MDPTVKDLVDLLIKSVPTIVFFVFLAFYLNAVFFKPIGKVLDERKKATEGVRALAEEAFAAADKKTSEFERALQAARAQLHKEHEATRQKWLTENTEAIANARADADRQITEVKQAVQREMESAQAELDTKVDSLSQQIVQNLLRGRAA